MLRNLAASSIVLLFAWITAGHSYAQTQAAIDRTKNLAQYIVTAPLCLKFGYILVPNGATTMPTAAAREVQTLGMSKQAVKLIIERHGRSLKQDLDVTVEKSKGRSSPLNAFFASKIKVCESASHDPLIATYLSAPIGFNPKQAAIDAADVLLVPSGLASWQTPSIVARGDLLMAAGSCRKQLGGERVDALLETYARSDNARERTYFEKSYDSGLEDTELTLNRTQCERAIAKFKKAAGAPK